MENRKYELFLVLPGTLNDQEAVVQANAVLETVKGLADSAELHTLGKNRLAYPIKQIRYGYFYTVVFSTTPEKVKVLEDKMRLSREVLRSMVSHFNTSLTAMQKIAYTTEGNGLANLADKPEVAPAMAAAMPKPQTVEALEKMIMAEEKPAPKKTKSPVERKIDTANLDEINKKLDDLMSGDVIPTV